MDAPRKYGQILPAFVNRMARSGGALFLWREEHLHRPDSLFKVDQETGTLDEDFGSAGTLNLDAFDVDTIAASDEALFMTTRGTEGEFCRLDLDTGEAICCVPRPSTGAGNMTLLEGKALLLSSSTLGGEVLAHALDGDVLTTFATGVLREDTSVFFGARGTIAVDQGQVVTFVCPRCGTFFSNPAESTIRRFDPASGSVLATEVTSIPTLHRKVSLYNGRAYWLPYNAAMPDPAVLREAFGPFSLTEDETEYTSGRPLLLRIVEGDFVLAGHEASDDGLVHRLERRDVTNGELVTTFGDSGTVRFVAGGDTAWRAMAVTGDAILTVRGHPDELTVLERRALQDGLVNGMTHTSAD